MSRIATITALFLATTAIFTANAVWGQSQTIEQTSEPSENTSATYKYEGNLISRKFHQPNCPFSLVMSRSRKINFDTKKAALAEGYRPCRFCLANASRTVRAKLINLDISR